MAVQISFQKGRNKPDTLSVRRSDGSVTWSQGHAGPAYHDLAHFAVETVLKTKQGFFSIIDQGFAIDDFVLPRHRRPDALKGINLPAEAMQVEYIVNRIQLEHFNGHEDPNFLPSLRQVLIEKNLPFPDSLTESAVAQIRARYQALVNQWDTLPPGGTMTLDF
jgi:hypothetical protein